MAKVTNQKAADILEEIGLILGAEGVPYKPDVYQDAAATIRGLDQEIARLYKECGKKCIDDLPGIGESITEKIEELVTTDKLPYYTRLKKKYPLDLLALTKIQEVGAKTAVELYKKLGIKTVAQLEKAARAGKIAKLKGFGEKSEANILMGIGFLKEHKGRYRLHEVYPMAQGMIAKIKKLPGVTHVDMAGSLRRMKETIGDIDILVTAKDEKKIRAAIRKFPEVSRVLEDADTKIRVRYTMGINGDIRILKSSEYGAGLLYFAGSKNHNVELRKMAIKKKMKLSEFGLFKGKKVVAGKTEASIYRALGLPFIEAELREWPDIIDVAKAGKLPKLLPYGSVKGDLQVQTKRTDGHRSIAEMAREAKKRGLSYIAITDHTKAQAMMRGQDEKALKKQGHEIDQLNKKMKNFRILKSVECDVLKDGRLDLADEALKTLDVVSISIHSEFKMREKQQTERLIRAMKNPLVNIVFHPTTRIVNRRGPIALDMAKIIRAAKQYKVALEVNGSARLDLKDKHIRNAVEHGVKLVISSDAHDYEDFDYIHFAEAQARRGFATKSDILNTKPVGAFLKALRK